MKAVRHETTVGREITLDFHLEVERGLRRLLPNDTFLWYNPPDESSRPTFVALAPQLGLSGLSVYDWSLTDIREATSSNGALRLPDPSVCRTRWKFLTASANSFCLNCHAAKSE